jgi:dTDP-4-amino-4,6-dideoxygalactose transaminase
MQYARKKGVDTEIAFAGSILARRPVAPDPETTREIPGDGYPNARSVALRCIRFPLYPALTSREAATIERVLTTLP